MVVIISENEAFWDTVTLTRAQPCCSWLVGIPTYGYQVRGRWQGVPDSFQKPVFAEIFASMYSRLPDASLLLGMMFCMAFYSMHPWNFYLIFKNSSPCIVLEATTIRLFVLWISHCSVLFWTCYLRTSYDTPSFLQEKKQNCMALSQADWYEFRIRLMCSGKHWYGLENNFRFCSFVLRYELVSGKEAEGFPSWLLAKAICHSNYLLGRSLVTLAKKVIWAHAVIVWLAASVRCFHLRMVQLQEVVLI